MAEATKPAASGIEPPKGWLERFRDRVNNSWWMQENRLPSIGRELAYAVEDIRHKVVEEGMFGRQVTPSTFPDKTDDAALPARKFGPGIHGKPAEKPGNGGPDIHGNGGPSGSSPTPGTEDKQARRDKFLAMCREVAERHPAPDRGIDRDPGVAPPSR